MNWRTDLYKSFINLDWRRDRFDHMNKELDRVGITVDCVTRGMPPNEYRGPLDSVRKMLDRTPGAIGCHFSQVHIMKRALELNKGAFVMEDDLILSTDIKERLDYISNWTKSNDWDVFWLGGTFHSPAFWHPIGPSKMKPNCSANIGRDVEPTEDHRIVRTWGAFSTFAYIVNVKSIQKILDLFDKHIHESIGIDWLFIKLQPQLRCYAFVPGCVKQMDNQSDIGNGVTVFSGFSKLNGTVENSRYWFQDKMEDFNPDTFKWK